MLVSEFMLQQTRVETAIPYYLRFLERFPTVADLAAADPEDVLALWAGLGYYRRARYLHETARRIVAELGGRVPDDPERLRRLPGIGPYTAAAVASIAYGRPVAAVDGNVLRVMARLLGEEGALERAGVRRRLAEAAGVLVVQGPPGDVNQALMELGATVCTPRAPACAGCPLAAACTARREGKQHRLPTRRAGGPPRTRPLTAGLLVLPGGTALRRRPDQGLLAGLWELPWVEGHGKAARARLAGLFAASGLPVTVADRLDRRRWVFSHLAWDVELWRLAPAAGVEDGHVAREQGAMLRETPGTAPQEPMAALPPIQVIPTGAVATRPIPALFRRWLDMFGAVSQISPSL